MMVAAMTFPSRITARSSPAPTARIALCGGLMMAVNSLIPNMPRLEMEKAPPSYSCGFSFFALARSASDFVSLEISMRPLVSPLKIIGVLVFQDGRFGPARIDVGMLHQRHGGGFDREVVDRKLVTAFGFRRFLV